MTIYAKQTGYGQALGAFLSLVSYTLRELVLYSHNGNNCLITMAFVCISCQHEIITSKDRVYVLS